MNLRLVLAAPFVALLILIGGLVVTHHAGVPFVDPDHGTAKYLVMVAPALALLIWVDIRLRARRTGRTTTDIRAERWTRRRVVAVFVGLLSFYIGYLAYRNLKGAVPLLAPHRLVDGGLADADRWLFFGHDPARLLHDLPLTDVFTQIFSTFYVAFIVFLPLSLAIALVFAPSLSGSLLLATAYTMNWLIGAVSYYVLPALGPAYAEPGQFDHLPHSEVTHLQQVLLDQRVDYLAHPTTAAPQAIAAFASLHVAMSFTALLIARQLKVPARLQRFLWFWLIMTTFGTIFLGWHYVWDDIAGLGIGAVSMGVAWFLTGFSRETAPAEPPAQTAVAA